MKQTLAIFFVVLLGLTVSTEMSGQITINMDNDVIRKDETVCVDLVVEDFDDLVAASFAVSWDPVVLDFEEATNLSSIFNIGDFGLTQTDAGKLSFQWYDAGSGVSLPDGQILFSLCFTGIGEPGDEAKVRIVGTGGDPGIEVLDINDENIGLRAADAIIKINYEDVPENSVILYYDDVNIEEGERFCIPVRVKNFVNMNDLQFSMEYNTTRFRFEGVDFKEEKSSDWFAYTDDNSDLQILYQGYDASFDAVGISIPDDDRLIEVCFTHLLQETCVFEELLISSNPLTIDASRYDPEGSERVPVIYQPGKIRLQKPIIYNDSQIQDVTCTNPNIGQISVDASGGTDGIKYLWSTGDTTNTIANLTAGTYSVSISDFCRAVDTIFKSFQVLVEGDLPTADAGDDFNLECSSEAVSLDGSGSTSGGMISYSWNGLDGQTIVGGGMTSRPEIDEGGKYEIVVTNSESGCWAMDTVEVLDVRELPEVMAGEDVRLECDDVSIMLFGSGDNGFNHEYTWTLDGNILEPTSKTDVEVDRAGTYTLQITDKATQCSATDDVVVTGGNVMPDLNIVGSTSITCTDSVLTLGANVVEQSGIAYSWTTVDGSIMAGDDQFNVVINAPGTYNVVATNTASSCTSEDNIIVTDLRTMPTAMAGDDARLGCDDTNLSIQGSGATGSQYEYSWSTVDGSIDSQTPDGAAVVSNAGTYTFIVRNTDNGCSASDDMRVTGDNERPLASISGSTTLDCTNSSLNLNANNGAGGVTGLSYQWTTQDGSITNGADQVWVTIDQPGTYIVSITDDATMCGATATVNVTSEVDEPEVSASDDETIDCSTEIKTLTVTSNDMTNRNFEWNVIEGDGQIVSGAANATVEVMGAGKYEIIVTNPFNGCSSRDTTTVALNGALPEAEVGMDYDHCEDETILMGNLEAGVIGQWTVIQGSAILEDPTDRNCRVNSLSPGVNTFVWTLSSEGCPDYSSDTININFVPEPIAVADKFEVTQGFGSLDIDLLNNDQYSTETGASINLSSQPTLGTLIENGNGQFTYVLDDPEVFGVFTFEYELCDDLCSLSCDYGEVTIDVRDGSLPIGDPNARNAPQSLGITPNGDGLNDQLVFEELLNNADSYGTRRLIVYNRWGDIVHEAQPYNNDWGGTSNGGDQLPQGTYYFVMQLDLGQGLIIEGDVTILQ